MKYFFLILIFACAPLRNDNYMIGWTGMPVSSLRTHAYFSKLPKRVIQRSAVFTKLEYREADGQRTRIDCEQIGGCVGLQYLAECVYEFEVESTIITAASLHGECKRDPRLLPD